MRHPMTQSFLELAAAFSLQEMQTFMVVRTFRLLRLIRALRLLKQSPGRNI